MGNSAFPRASSHLHDLCGLVERLCLNWMTTQRLWVILQIGECGCDWEAWPLPCLVVQTWVRGEVWRALQFWVVWQGLRSSHPEQSSETAGLLLCVSASYPSSLLPSVCPNWHLGVRYHLTQTYSRVSVGLQTQAECVRTSFLPPTLGPLHSNVAQNRLKVLQKEGTNQYRHKWQKKWSREQVSSPPQLYWDTIHK